MEEDVSEEEETSLLEEDSAVEVEASLVDEEEEEVSSLVVESRQAGRRSDSNDARSPEARRYSHAAWMNQSGASTVL